MRSGDRKGPNHLVNSSNSSRSTSAPIKEFEDKVFKKNMTQGQSNIQLGDSEETGESDKKDKRAGDIEIMISKVAESQRVVIDKGRVPLLQGIDNIVPYSI